MGARAVTRTLGRRAQMQITDAKRMGNGFQTDYLAQIRQINGYNGYRNFKVRSARKIAVLPPRHPAAASFESCGKRSAATSPRTSARAATWAIVMPRDLPSIRSSTVKPFGNSSR